MDNADSSIAGAPLPTPQTLKARANIPFQIFRFIVINFKMLNIIRKEHQ